MYTKYYTTKYIYKYKKNTNIYINILLMKNNIECNE